MLKISYRKCKITCELICKGSNEKRQMACKIKSPFQQRDRDYKKKSNGNSRNQKHSNSDEESLISRDNTTRKEPMSLKKCRETQKVKTIQKNRAENLRAVRQYQMI